MPEAHGFERRRLRVYVAGPISKGDTLRNIHRGVEAGAKLFADGFAPYIPHFDAYMTFAAAAETPGEGDAWKALLEWDLEWVAASDAVYRLKGVSKGADLECEVAAGLGIPVFYEGDPYSCGIASCAGACGAVGYVGLQRYAESLGLTGVRRGTVEA